MNQGVCPSKSGFVLPHSTQSPDELGLVSNSAPEPKKPGHLSQHLRDMDATLGGRVPSVLLLRGNWGETKARPGWFVFPQTNPRPRRWNGGMSISSEPTPEPRSRLGLWGSEPPPLVQHGDTWGWTMGMARQKSFRTWRGWAHGSKDGANCFLLGQVGLVCWLGGGVGDFSESSHIVSPQQKPSIFSWGKSLLAVSGKQAHFFVVL